MTKQKKPSYQARCGKLAKAHEDRVLEYSARATERKNAHQERIQAEAENIRQLDLSREELVLKCATLITDAQAAAEVFADYMEAVEIIKAALDIAAPMADKLSDSNSTKAKLPRGKVNTDNGETVPIKELISRLANEREHRKETAKELWSHFFALLDENGLDPKEGDDGIVYACNGVEKTMSLKRFSNIVSDARKTKNPDSRATVTV